MVWYLQEGRKRGGWEGRGRRGLILSGGAGKTLLSSWGCATVGPGVHPVQYAMSRQTKRSTL